EGRRAREPVVLPADDAPGVAWEASKRQADEPREPLFDRRIPTGLVDDAFVLVEPDRDLRSDAQDQPIRKAALRLGQWPRARVVDAAERPPGPREVAVEIDAVRVLARVRRVPVGIHGLDHPEIDACWRP